MPEAPLVLAGGARVRCTGRDDGDLRVGPQGPGPEVEARRQRLVPLPWTWLHQVHGAEVVVVAAPGAGAGAAADAAVTAVPGAALAVHTADCAPVGLASPEGVIGVAHAGWRGLVAGVVGATVAAMRDLGATRLEAVLGPCIRPCCYEFGADDLEVVAAGLGEGVRGRTTAGAPALDVPEAVRAALAAAGVDDVTTVGGCTGCGGGWFSHRARRDPARQAMVVWRDPAP